MVMFMLRLQELRKELGLTQTELAKKMGFTQQSIANWEGSERQPNMDTIRRFCAFFGVTIDYFLGLSCIRSFDVSEEDYALLLAYHAAPDNIRDGIKVTLQPFWEAGTLSASGSGQGGDSHGAL